MRSVVFLFIGLALSAYAFSCSGDTAGDTTAGSGGTGGGGGAGGGQAACIEGLTSIALAPADQTIKLDGSSAAPVEFTVTGTFGDGHTEAIDASKLDWAATREDDTLPATSPRACSSRTPLRAAR